MKYITESESNHHDLDKMSVEQILRGINQEDKCVPLAVEKAIPAITEFVEKALPRMQDGGRLFYIGAGTSGRLGIVDASEIPPTYGMPAGVRSRGPRTISTSRGKTFRLSISSLRIFWWVLLHRVALRM